MLANYAPIWMSGSLLTQVHLTTTGIVVWMQIIYLALSLVSKKERWIMN